MTITFSQYITYFRNIAINNTEIGHTVTEKHFYSIDEEEALLGLANTMKYPAMVLEGYDFKFTDLDSDNVLKGRMGAFTIFKKVTDPNDTDLIYQTYQDCEAIIDEIINLIRMHKEERTHEIVADFNFNSINAIRISNDDLGYGIRVSFKIDSTHNPAVDESKWITTNF